jgi:protein-L-isoaspartate(D-aspartate) O-methyltransferase
VSEHNFSTMRAAMVASQLRTNNVNDPAVLAVMDNVEREAFVPADRAALAYIDVPIPLGSGRSLNAPLATGWLLVSAHVREGDRVLLIGAATGYAAALIAELAGAVTAVEESSSLIGHARGAIGTDDRITLIEAPLAAGHAAGAPYDLIMIDGAVAQLPAALTDQLAVGGRLVCGLIDNGVTRLAHGIRSIGGFAIQPFAEIEIVPLPGFEKSAGFHF